MRTVHGSVVGIAPDGRPYSASDPTLITWVHAAEVRSFLSAATIYGTRTFTLGDQDRYVDEMARVAVALGAAEVPRNVSELEAYFDTVRPELRLTGEARTARNSCSEVSGDGPTRSLRTGSSWQPPREYFPPGLAGSCTWPSCRRPTGSPCARWPGCSPALSAGWPRTGPSMTAAARSGPGATRPGMTRLHQIAPWRRRRSGR